MARLFTPDEFSFAVVENFNWRLRELSALKLAIDGAPPIDKAALVRALVVMCYAHWEGHVKFCAERFVEYLSIRRLRFDELSPRFYEVRFLRELGASGNLSYDLRTELIRKILHSQADRMSHFPRDLVDTRSNLNSHVLYELCHVCNLEYSHFLVDEDFIDRILLKRRNEVAHGESTFIDVVDADELVSRTSALMRKFRDLIDTSVSLQGYRAAA